MDMNSVTLAGWVKRAGIKEGQYPFGWAQIELEAIRTIDQQTELAGAYPVFVGFNIKSDRDRGMMSQLQAGGWVTVWDCTLTSRPDKQNPAIEVRGVQGALNRISVTQQRGFPENIVLLHGRVEDTHGANWVKLGCSYMNPKEPDPQKKWKTRNIKLFVPGGVGNLGIPVMERGRSYYVRGRVLSRDPVNGKEDVIVTADLVTG